MMTGRQPARLPFGFAALRRLAVGVAVSVLLAAPAMAQQMPDGDGDILVMAVDSSRLPESEDAPRRVAPRPVGDGVDGVIRDLNQRGGILGRRLRAVHEDDHCAADEAAAIAARAVAQRVSVVIGHACSSGAIKAAAVYARASLVMIATGPRHPRLTSPVALQGIHRLAGRDDRQDESIAALIAAHFPAARAAIVHDPSLQARGMAEEIRRSMTAAQATPVLAITYRAGSKDYGAIVAALAEAKVNLVIFPGQPFEASMILDQARQAGLRIETAIGTDVLAAESPPARLLAAVEAFLVMLPWSGESHAVSVSASADESAARALAGAALEAWASAVAESNSLTPDGVIRELRGAARPTRVGALHFDAQGDAVVPSYVPHIWRDGAWRAWP